MSLLKFTGNPLIDAGSAVITMVCGKEQFEDVTKDDILENIDSFLEVVKDHYNDLSANKKELEYSKRGLKQHFILLYNTNHYIFGINNKMPNAITGKKETVATGEDFAKTFKQEVINILEGKNKLTEDIERKSTNNICKFCGRPADIILSKDIVPLSTGLTQKNLGQVHSCNYCYLPILFNFVVMINVRSSEQSKGTYMFYHFSNEQYMIEYAREQFQRLKGQALASLETKIGMQYEVLADDLYDRLKKMKRILRNNNSLNGFTTAYFLLNDNRGATFNYINVPDGVCSFLIRIGDDKTNLNKIKKNLRGRDDYEDFFSGDFICINYDGTPKEGFEDSEILKAYLKEVSNLEDKLITAAESIAKGLLVYYRSQEKQWIEKYSKKIDVVKANNFINQLLDDNEKYFKVNGENIFTVGDIKEVTSNKEMAFRLIKYFILNNMTDEEKTQFVEINKKKFNQSDKEE